MVISASISDWVVMVFHAGASSPNGAGIHQEVHKTEEAHILTCCCVVVRDVIFVQMKDIWQVC